MKDQLFKVGENTGNIFNVRVCPSGNVIRNLNARMERTGSVSDLPGRGLKRSVRTDVGFEAVRQGVLEGPSASTRRISTQHSITRTSL